MPRVNRSLDELRLLGGSLPLDFVNSVDWRADARPVEYLDDYEAVLTWSRRLGTLTEPEATALRASSGRDPEAAIAAVTRLRALREDLYLLICAIVRDERPDERHLDRMRRWYGAAVAAGELREADGRLVLDWPDDHLERPGWPLAEATWNLLTDTALDRVKMCPAAGCGWLFLDRSKGGTRRWCSMDGCGARMKMRRAYARARHPEERDGSTDLPVVNGDLGA